MESDKSQSVTLRRYHGPVAGVKVLVVDANSACRTIVSKMLISLGYEVMTASLASDALSIICEKKNEVNLVLVEVQLPDMEIYELIEKMGESSNLPSFIMTAYDDDTPSISRALGFGAKWCFRKPVQISDLHDLWRFAVWNRYETTVTEAVPDFVWRLSDVIMATKGLACQPSMNTGERSRQNAIGLEGQPSLNAGEKTLRSANGKEHEFPDNDNSVLLNRKRKSWTDDLHRKFLEAVEIAGIDAGSKTIFQIMNVEEFTKESASNYLQRYRQSMNLRATAMEQHVNGYVSRTNKSQGKCPLEKQVLINDPKDLSNFVPVHILDTSATFLPLESSSCQESPFSQNQLSLPLEQQGVAHTTSSLGRFINRVNDDVSEKISQVFNTEDGEVSNAGQQLNFSTPLTFDMCEPLCTVLPMPPLPPDEKAYYDKFFYAKGTQLFTDEDLKMWLSTIRGMNMPVMFHCACARAASTSNVNAVA
ncbi:putative response regulator and transcription factor RR-A-type family [Medicago truncatula]|uniref:Putative response regulator and transcription factor RR-A-type family n=2 Tax=Medicago truncatula TaxID=3880 RepID=A0A072TZK7_MEDTR|nr:two-component response regulator ORR22 isoform X2 [Medicago truncatula]XP_024627533.1 two-component response regulator ORR22 isoform X2 [Medicago truncatula]KEH18975.1 response regulator receiver domain protein [Medicago truncatula]RHN40070.1 putative response regulator and transcription factor RR-A-type family [Medicago truncatula]